ncbi:hypothetical protein F6X40_11140 [Paraburkholderia sp. UCT31]|uniref:hypothetical protein n=1 Tax=Paraburkholderia sp. UCT31 TaxID=2615209 RepID=UPI001655C939|nr:hypothetical protein [Paraburkholderia sp. UCT31]MBC8737358.1 hypothetical protein [Paraburkholderia sp. UCT31]
MKAQKSGREWKAGQYGLVEMNDPTIVFDGPLAADPGRGMSDDELNALFDQPGEDGQCFRSLDDAYTEAAERLQPALELDAVTGYRLVKACVEVGYRPGEDGFLHYWLMHRMATIVGARP